MSQIFLFSGENEYELQQERTRWVQNFVHKHGMENLSQIQGKQVTFQSLLSEVSAAPFIADKRLILVDFVPKLEKEQMEDLLQSIHPSVLLAFIDPKPDKRLSSVKILQKHADVKHFPSLPVAQLGAWIESFTQSLSGHIEKDAIVHLLQSVGEDQQLLAQELRKLALYAHGRAITREDIDLLAVCSTEQAVWRLMDLVSDGKVDTALTFARELMEKGESPYALWNMLLWMLSQLVLVAGAFQDGQRSPAAIMKSTGASFGSVRSLAGYAGRINPQALHALVCRFVQVDLDLKTGVYRSTTEAPEELHALIDSCITSLVLQTHVEKR